MTSLKNQIVADGEENNLRLTLPQAANNPQNEQTIESRMDSAAVSRLFLLNRFELENGSIPFRTDKTRALLAYLAVESQQPHHRNTLATLLWPDSPGKRARANLRLALHNLRHILQGVAPDIELLETTYSTVRLNPQASLWVDVLAFEQLLAAARVANGEEQRQLWETAVSLYSGDFCRGLHVRDTVLFEEWLLLKQEQFHRQAIDALQKLLRFWQTQKNSDGIQQVANRLIQFMPLHEKGHIGLMKAYGLSGDLGRVRETFNSYCLRLREASDEEPGEAIVHALQRLEGQPAAVEPPVATPRSSNLPATTTPFFGRQTEQMQLGQWLTKQSYRLITLVGMGGIGKTRLALEVAQQQQSHFSDGVWFVSLASLETTEPLLLETQIAEAIAHAVGLELKGSLPAKQQLCSWLHERKLLLILDNWEHIIEGADIVADLLKAAANLSVLCTSQVTLDFQMERIFEVEGLPVPALEADNACQFDSVQLFWERAERFVQLTQVDLPQIVALCGFVEGHPLAMELAAAALRHMPLAELLEELTASPTVLDVTFRDLPRRQRNVQALCDHAWLLLGAAEQEIMCRLAVMNGQFSEKAALKVAQTDEAMLYELYDRSLLQRVSADYFALHSLLRRYVLDKLEKRPLLKQQAAATHADYYLNWVAGNLHPMIRRGSLVVIQALQAESSNIKAAWSFAIRERLSHLISLSASAWGAFNSYQGNIREGMRLFAYELEGDGLDRAGQIAQGWLYCHRAYFLFQLGETSAAESFFAKAEAIAEAVDDARLILYVAYHIADFQITMKDVVALDTQLDRVETLARAQEHYSILGLITIFRGSVKLQRGLLDEALIFLQQAQAIAEAHDFVYVMLQSYVWQLEVLIRLERWELIPALCAKATILAKEMDEHIFRLTTAVYLSMYYRKQQQLTQSLALLEETVVDAERVEHELLLLKARLQRGLTLAALERHERAVAELQFVATAYERLGSATCLRALAEIGRIQQQLDQPLAARSTYGQLIELAVAFDKPVYVEKGQKALDRC
ncbi:MAG: NB-ARC domain-containing protein [Chloroflexota bacterium]